MTSRPKIVLLILTTIVFHGCGSGSETPESEVFERSLNVSTTIVRPTVFVNTLSLVGTVKAGNDIRVSAEVSGMVTRVAVGKGQSFRKGDLILKIDDASLRQELEIAKANTETALENYERTRKLWETDRIGSEFAVITAANAWRSARASQELLQIRLEKTTLTATFDGMVEEVYVEAGEMANPGAPLVRLIESGRLFIEAGVPARHARSVSVGDPMDVTFEVAGQIRYRTRVSRVGTAIDPSVRTFRIEAELPPNRSYKVDMIANIRIETERFTNAIVVNQEFVQRDENGYKVYVARDVDGRKRAVPVRVELGPTVNNEVVILSGLNAGDELITRGAVFAENNILLTILNDAEVVL
jgi:membrane fusion protein (multidrug efflux system)